MLSVAAEVLDNSPDSATRTELSEARFEQSAVASTGELAERSAT